MKKKRLAIFASGAGSNARKIISHFKNNPVAEVALIVCNKPGAGVLQVAEGERIPSILIENQYFKLTGVLSELKENQIDFIILAGFLRKIPPLLIEAFPRKIINIHPALLPKYGGKGMYGSYVHDAVIAAGDKESGITIHYVDEHYDHGDIIFQASCPIIADDTPETLAQKIHALEYQHFPRVIASIVSSQK